MAITFVIGFAAGQGTGTAIATSGATPASGNFIVAAATTTANNVVSSFTDNKGNTYTLLPSVTAANGNVITLGYAANITIGGSITVTVNCGVSNAMAVAAACFSGVATTSPFDKSSSQIGTSASLDTGLTPTTTFPNELLIGAGEQGRGSNVTWTAGTIGAGAYALASHMDLASAGRDIYLEYLIVSSTGAYNAPCGSDSSFGYAAAIATFADTPVPSGSARPGLLLMGVG